jgi:ArsR family transcriptional regulator
MMPRASGLNVSMFGNLPPARALREAGSGDGRLDIPVHVHYLDNRLIDIHLIDDRLNDDARERMLDETLRALGDPTRREILTLLRGGDLTAGEISGRFTMTAASVSHHLSVLKEAGLVRSQRSGRNLVYSLEATVFQEFLQQMLELFGKGEER